MSPDMATAAQKLMRVMPPPGDPITVAEAAARSRVPRKTAARALGTLLSAGLVERRETGVYRLTQAGVEARAAGTVSKSGPKGPHTGRRRATAGTFRARLWSALRVRRTATIPELLTLAAKAGDRGAHANARKYLHVLERAGYVARLKRRAPGTKPTSNGHLQWTLLPEWDTGALAPAWHPKLSQVHDRNTHEVHHV